MWTNILPFAGLVLAAPRPQGAGGRGNAMLRFGCSQVVIERIDPLVNPGSIPSAHMHQVVGGNAFNASMPMSDIAELATCTTCQFDEDFSNYWTANLYFKARNGSYKRVPQMANQGLTGDNGGITVYYTSPSVKATTAFKPGFRMLAGDAMRRVSAGLGRNTQSCFRCFSGANFGGNTQSPCMDSKADTEGFPKTPCPGGIRSSVIFPLCWDGKNLDSPDHQSHVAHPTSGPTSFAVVTGTCPASHPVKIPQIHLEIVWDTRQFNNKADWPADGKQPFVLSTGDDTGFGQHGDYAFGWKGDSLQRAMDAPCYLNCNVIKSQSAAVKNKCQVPNIVKEEVDGWMPSLPGITMKPK